uniref:Si:dkey-74k8.3 n=1 Tax=Hucho hucho TaxID=62062 RepID=A0A4W5L6L5_9TELE
MTSYNRADSSSVPVLLSTLVLMLGLAARCVVQAMPSEDSPQAAPASVSLRYLVTGTCKDVHKYVESVVGTNVIESTVEFFEMLIRFLAEGAASGLNVIAVYVTEILRVTGVDVQLPFPHFTPEGVASVGQWALLALIGYWLLSIVLRLLVGVVRRVFWMLKAGTALWLFGLIVSDAKAGSDTTAVRLAGLVLGCALLGLASYGSEKTIHVEDRLSILEGRVKAVERRKGDE